MVSCRFSLKPIHPLMLPGLLVRGPKPGFEFCLVRQNQLHICWSTLFFSQNEAKAAFFPAQYLVDVSWSCICSMAISVPTIYKAYFWGLNFRGYPHNSCSQKYGTFTYLHQLDPEDLPLICWRSSTWPKSRNNHDLDPIGWGSVVDFFLVLSDRQILDISANPRWLMDG